MSPKMRSNWDDSDSDGDAVLGAVLQNAGGQDDDDDFSDHTDQNDDVDFGLGEKPPSRLKPTARERPAPAPAPPEVAAARPSTAHGARPGSARGPRAAPRVPAHNEFDDSSESDGGDFDDDDDDDLDLPQGDTPQMPPSTRLPQHSAPQQQQQAPQLPVAQQRTEAPQPEGLPPPCSPERLPPPCSPERLPSSRSRKAEGGGGGGAGGGPGPGAGPLQPESPRSGGEPSESPSSPGSQTQSRGRRPRKKTPTPKRAPPVSDEDEEGEGAPAPPQWSPPRPPPCTWRLEADWQAVTPAVALCCPLAVQDAVELWPVQRGAGAEPEERMLLFRTTGSRVTGKLALRRGEDPGTVRVRWLTWPVLSRCPLPLTEGEAIVVPLPAPEPDTTSGSDSQRQRQDEAFLSLEYGRYATDVKVFNDPDEEQWGPLPSIPDVQFQVDPAGVIVMMAFETGGLMLFDYAVPNPIPPMLRVAAQADRAAAPQRLAPRGPRTLHLGELPRALIDVTSFSKEQVQRLAEDWQEATKQDVFESGDADAPVGEAQAREFFFGPEDDPDPDAFPGFLIIEHFLTEEMRPHVRSLKDLPPELLMTHHFLSAESVRDGVLALAQAGGGGKGATFACLCELLSDLFAPGAPTAAVDFLAALPIFAYAHPGEPLRGEVAVEELREFLGSFIPQRVLEQMTVRGSEGESVLQLLLRGEKCSYAELRYALARDPRMLAALPEVLGLLADVQGLLADRDPG